MMVYRHMKTPQLILTQLFGYIELVGGIAKLIIVIVIMITMFAIDFKRAFRIIFCCSENAK